MRLAARGLLMLGGALVQVTWASHLEIAGAFPNLVLIAVVTLTWTQGVRTGLVWACGGGILLDLNAPGPVGLHALALLPGAYVTGFWARNLDHASLVHPAAAVAVATIIYSLALIGADGALGLPIPPSRTALQLTVSASLYNAALMPLALLALRRLTAGSRLESSAS